MSFVSVDLSYKVLGCAFAVYNDLGPFFREAIYQRALEVALADAGLEWERQKSIAIEFRGVEVGKGLLDLVVENKVILELKAVEGIHPTFVSQLLQYLAASRLELGWLIGVICGIDARIKATCSTQS